MSQQLPADFEEKMDNFRKFTADAIAEYNIDPSHIINMDEVPLTFDLPLQRTVAPKGESTVNLRTANGLQGSSASIKLCLYAIPCEPT